MEPVQIECELTIQDCNGAEAAHTHTWSLILPDMSSRIKNIKNADEGVAVMTTGLTGVIGFRAEAKFRRLQ